MGAVEIIVIVAAVVFVVTVGAAVLYRKIKGKGGCSSCSGCNGACGGKSCIHCEGENNNTKKSDEH